MMTVKEFPVRRPQDVSRLGDRTLKIALVPTDAERAAMIEAYGLLSLPELKADLELRPWRKDGVTVEGHLQGRVSQACVVTLEPVEQVLDARFTVRFAPGAAVEDVDEDGEIVIDVQSEDPPDPLEGDEVDLGAVLCEQFALALDPYPRAEGAQVPEAYADAGETAENGGEAPARPSPFAVLADLKKKQS
ncbi:YceD family protein [Stappia indica]|uniref:YceD family protein n=1 Tax=Stappia indica TaxID=538381 RepID=UPI001CD80C0F|nr:DUF177 domain-containing protein [Stappia indica]MCA1297210.1 DUF177 domain-containing protein [Stappia indica]